jgi:hypothetical protein
LSRKNISSAVRKKERDLNLTVDGIYERTSTERIILKPVFKMKLKWENSVFHTEYAYINSL